MPSITPVRPLSIPAVLRRRCALAAGVAALLLLLVGVPSASALPPTTPDLDAAVPDQPVLAVAHHDTRTYLAGEFTSLGDWNGAAAELSLPGGTAASTYPQVLGGDVYAAVSDGSGGTFIGGDFTRVGGTSRAGLAHITATGTLDPQWHPSHAGTVRALALAPNHGRLYVAGGTPDVDQDPHFLAAINPATGVVDPNWNPCTQLQSTFIGNGEAGWTYALAVSADSSTVYVGGTFDHAGGAGGNCASPTVRHNVASFTAANGTLTTWNPNTDYQVYALALQGSNVILGGAFGSVGASVRHGIASVNATTAALNSWNPGQGGSVRALAVDGPTVFAGGGFSHVGTGNVARNGVAAIDAAGNATTFDAGITNLGLGGVAALAFDDPSDPRSIAIGGTITTADGHRNLTLVDETTGSQNAHFAAAPGGEVLALASVGANRMAVGGFFRTLDAQWRKGLAVLDPAGQPTPVSFGNDGYGARAIALSPDGRTLYEASSQTGLHAFATDDGHELPWNPTTSTIDVGRLVVSPDGSTVYLAGGFTQVDGQPRVHLAAVSATGTGAVTPWRPDPDGVVSALALSPDGSVVYVGGAFAAVGPSVQFRANLAALSASTGEPTAWAPNPDGPVSAVAVSDDGARVYASGAFTHIGTGGQARGGIAALTATNGNATPFGIGGGIDEGATSIVTTAGAGPVYLGGAFDFVGGNANEGIAALDSAAGSGLLWFPQFAPNSGGIPGLAADGDTVWAGGWTALTGGDQRPYYAQFTTEPEAAAGPVVASAQEGAATTCATATWRNAPASIDVTWQLDGTDVAGASDRSFTPPAGSAGKALTCRETAENPGGSTVSTSAAATVAAAAVPGGGGGDGGGNGTGGPGGSGGDGGTPGPGPGSGGDPGAGGSGGSGGPGVVPSTKTVKPVVKTSSVRLDGHRRFVVKLTGAPKAKGTLKLTYTIKKTKKKRARTVTLASVRFTLGAKGTVSVKVTLSRAAVKVVTKARTLKTTATATVGQASSAKRAVAVRPAKPAKRHR